MQLDLGSSLFQCQRITCDVNGHPTSIFFSRANKGPGRWAHAQVLLRTPRCSFSQENNYSSFFGSSDKLLLGASVCCRAFHMRIEASTGSRKSIDLCLKGAHQVSYASALVLPFCSSLLPLNEEEQNHHHFRPSHVTVQKVFVNFSAMDQKREIK